MKRRVLVGQALVHKPPVIVLDRAHGGRRRRAAAKPVDFHQALNGEGHHHPHHALMPRRGRKRCAIRVAMLKGGRVVALDTHANLLRGMSGITVQVSADALPRHEQSRGSDTQASGAFGFTLSGYPSWNAALRLPGGQHCCA